MRKEFYEELTTMYTNFMNMVDNSTKENVKETIDEMMKRVGCEKYSMKDSCGMLTYATRVEWKMKWDFPHINNTSGWYTGASTIIIENLLRKEEICHKGDLNQLAEDLTMAYCRTNNVNDFHNTYDLIHYLNGDKGYLDYEIIIAD